MSDDSMTRITISDLQPRQVAQAQPLAPLPARAIVNTTSAAASSATCSRCQGAGFYTLAVRFGHPDFGKLQRCSCKDVERAQAALARHDHMLASLADELGGDLARCTLDNYDLARAEDDEALLTLERALQIARRYVEAPEGWLYLYGPTGVGKSHLAAAIAQTLAHMTLARVSYASEPALIRYLRDGFADSTTDDRLEALQATDLLVLDDLGTTPRDRAGYVDGWLFDLLNHRYNHHKRTIITSNYDPDDLEARIRSRIRGRAQVVLIVNADQRGLER